MRYRAGQIFMLLALALTAFSIVYFAANALGKTNIPDYIRNHFLRESVFGLFLCAVATGLTLKPAERSGHRGAAMVGAVLVAPFWVGYLLGVGNSEISAVWGDAATPEDSVTLHTAQVALYLSGAALMALGSRREPRKASQDND